MRAQSATLPMADPRRVREQYRDSTSLDARMRLYALYGSQPSLQDWTFERLRLAELPAGAQVLELGCGSGNLWRGKAALIPSGPAISLSDLSSGMLTEAVRRLGPQARRFRWLQADARAIPLARGSVDLVIANRVLHNVSDRTPALAEIHRVLRLGGRLVATTNDWTHHIETRELIRSLGLDADVPPVGRMAGIFDVATAAAELAALFAGVRVQRYDSALEATEAPPIVDYVLSLCRTAPPSAVEALRAALEHHLALLGSFHMTVAIGLIEARRR
jgi:SAM-dependent methyltransferase